MKDYWLVVKDSPRAINMLKKHNLHVAVKLLVVSSLIFALGTSIIFSKIMITSGSFSGTAFAGIALTVFSLLTLLGLGMGLVLEFIAANLGGKGKYYESLASVAVFIAAPSLGIFVASLLFFVPFVGVLLGPFIMALTFGIGLSSFYKAIKELFRVDMVTSFVTVSVFIVSFFVLIYGAFALALLSTTLPLGG